MSSMQPERFSERASPCPLHTPPAARSALGATEELRKLEESLGGAALLGRQDQAIFICIYDEE